MQRKKINKFRIKLVRRHVPLWSFPWKWELYQALDYVDRIEWEYIASDIHLFESTAMRKAKRRMNREVFKADEIVLDKEVSPNE